MSGLKENSGNVTFVSIKDGSFVVKQENGQLKAYKSLGGIIKRVGFITGTSQQGRGYEAVKFIIEGGGATYQLDMYTDSRYFLSLCNFLKSSDITREIEISPSEKPNEHGKKVQTCFVRQDDKALKASYTRDNMGDLPPLEPVAGATYFDNTKQVGFWKKWLSETYGVFTPNNPFQNAAATQGTASTQATAAQEATTLTEPLDDLPF